MTKIKWGLLSTANINRRLIPAIRESERGELVAVASRNIDQASAYAKEWEIPQAFGSYEAMLQSGAVDAVYISLPNHLHADWSIKSLAQGVHVLCEKPFAISLAEVDAMIAAHKASGCVLAEAFMYRHHPQTKLVGEWLRAGRLGEVDTVRGVFSFFLANRDNVRLVPEFGGGSLWDVGVYPLSFAQYVFGGPPDWVSATQIIGESGVDDTFGGLLHYPGGGFAQISSSFRLPFQTYIEVLGTEGRLVVEQPFVGMDDGNSQLIFHPNQGEPETIAVPEKSLYLGQVEDMHAAILDGSANYLGLDETRNHVKTVLALYQAAQEQRIVYLD